MLTGAVMDQQEIEMIKLFDNWVILVDNCAYTVAEYLGEKKRTIYGYYGTLHGALKGFKDILIRKKLSDSCLTLSEAIKTITEEYAKIEKLLESVKWEEDDGK